MEIEIGSLLSRTKAKITRPGGVRQLLTGFASKLSTSTSSSGGGLIGWIWGIVKNVGGWLISKLWGLLTSFISWSFTTIVNWIQSTANFIWNFDWNQTDEQLDAQIENSYSALLTQAAGTLGGSLGWLVGGLAPGVVMFVFNEPLGVYLLNHVGEEMIEELLPLIGGLIRSTIRTLTRHALIVTYKRLRRWLVGNNEFKSQSDEQIAARYNKQVTDGTMTANQAKEAIEKGKRIRDAAKSGFERKPWSFAKKFEEWKETYIPKNMQDAAEEFVDEFSDAFWEGLYVNASTLDEYVAKQRLTRPAVLGAQTGVRITFNRNSGGSGTV